MLNPTRKTTFSQLLLKDDLLCYHDISMCARSDDDAYTLDVNGLIG